MDKRQTEKVLDAINKRGWQDLVCPVSGDSDWGVESELVVMPSLNVPNGAITFAVLTCGECGYSALVNVARLGIADELGLEVVQGTAGMIPADVRRQDWNEEEDCDNFFDIWGQEEDEDNEWKTQHSETPSIKQLRLMDACELIVILLLAVGWTALSFAIGIIPGLLLGITDWYFVGSIVVGSVWAIACYILAWVIDDETSHLKSHLDVVSPILVFGSGGAGMGVSVWFFGTLT